MYEEICIYFVYQEVINKEMYSTLSYSDISYLGVRLLMKKCY